MKFVFAVVAASCLALSCATAPSAPVTKGKEASASRFNRYERYLITSAAPSEVMAIVENDTPAGDAFLREKALDLDPADPLLDHLASRMLETVRKAPGVGIAAPQVGVSRRAAWIQRMDKPDKPFEFYINPRIVEYGPEKAVGWEGCLSVPAGFGQVERSTWVTVAHDTKEGEAVAERIEGFTAVIFQHELDHLDGVLFIDKKLPGELMPKEQYYEMRRKEKEAVTKEKPDEQTPAD